MKRLVCLGMGYSALALAERLRGRGGWEIEGTATSAESVSRLESMGFAAQVFDGSSASPGLAHVMGRATHIVASAAPAPGGDPFLNRHDEDIAAAPDLEWIGYLSTIGVYGDRRGEWIDETAKPNPSPGRSSRRLAAEAAWLELGERSGKRVQIFRLSGIYGPGRSAVDSLRDGTARSVVKPGQVFNRIHVDDIAATLVRAVETRGRHAIYNVTDDEPAAPEVVMAYAAAALGVSPPPEIAFDEANLSDMARSFYSENKRVRNERIKEDLGVRLAYPTYREGLSALASMTA